jgi:flavin-dependent dehydrogenase
MGGGYDAIVVGARCAGAVLAARLAGAGWRVVLVDRAGFPSDTISTHFLFPNTLDRLARLGVMDRLCARHQIPPLLLSWRVLGHQVAGGFTATGGYDRLACIRRITLDAALVDTALAAGAVGRFGTRVTGLVGGGRAGDPVRGVVLADGEVVRARWVLGADGRGSTVARALGLRREQELAGEFAMLFAYWTGLPDSEWFRTDVRQDHSLWCSPCEDGVHLIGLAGRPQIVHGDRLATYLAGIRRFPATLNPRLVDRAELVSRLLVAPEPMLRGYFRRAAGPGWALVGDAGHFKHPVTGQGIGDAVQQAWFVADALLGADPELAGYQRWREQRAAEHYEWSYRAAHWPDPERIGPLFAGLAADPPAAQEWRDLFTRRTRPSEVYTAERVAAWTAPRLEPEGAASG